jgi:hypothetical protein
MKNKTKIEERASKVAYLTPLVPKKDEGRGPGSIVSTPPLVISFTREGTCSKKIQNEKLG